MFDKLLRVNEVRLVLEWEQLQDFRMSLKQCLEKLYAKLLQAKLFNFSPRLLNQLNLLVIELVIVLDLFIVLINRRVPQIIITDHGFGHHRASFDPCLFNFGCVLCLQAQLHRLQNCLRDVYIVILLNTVLNMSLAKFL